MISHLLSSQVGADSASVDSGVDLHHLASIESLHLSDQIAEQVWGVAVDAIVSLRADLLQQSNDIRLGVHINRFIIHVVEEHGGSSLDGSCKVQTSTFFMIHDVQDNS